VQVVSEQLSPSSISTWIRWLRISLTLEVVQFYRLMKTQKIRLWLLRPSIMGDDRRILELPRTAWNRGNNSAEKYWLRNKIARKATSMTFSKSYIAPNFQKLNASLRLRFDLSCFVASLISFSNLYACVLSSKWPNNRLTFTWRPLHLSYFEDRLELRYQNSLATLLDCWY